VTDPVLPPDPSAPAAAAPKKTPGGKPPGKFMKPKSARRRSREFALQGLYEWLVSGAEAGVIDAHMREQAGFDKCDAAHFDALLHGCIGEASAIDAVLARHVDRKTSMLSPIEHGVLMLGVYELTHCIEIPYKVAINEAVELAKSFGGTDGHKYVNGVLDKSSADLRPVEVSAARAAR
jgi:transcription antitermination protein NusB